MTSPLTDSGTHVDSGGRAPAQLALEQRRRLGGRVVRAREPDGEAGARLGVLERGLHRRAVRQRRARLELVGDAAAVEDDDLALGHPPLDVQLDDAVGLVLGLGRLHRVGERVLRRAIRAVAGERRLALVRGGGELLDHRVEAVRERRRARRPRSRAGASTARPRRPGRRTRRTRAPGPRPAGRAAARRRGSAARRPARSRARRCASGGRRAACGGPARPRRSARRRRPPAPPAGGRRRRGAGSGWPRCRPCRERRRSRSARGP